MGDLGDLLGLGPAPRRRPRARTRCRDCSRPVYVDQLVYGLGRCCAEKAGLVIRRHRLAVTPQAGETLLDHLPKENPVGIDPFPQIRIDVAGLDPDEAHRRIVEHARAMITDAPDVVSEFPAGVTAATNAAFAGLAAILERHAPHLGRTGTPLCAHDWEGTQGLVTNWPCDDYRDAAAGLATGLRRITAGPPRELAEPTGPRTDDGDDPHAGAISAL